MFIMNFYAEPELLCSEKDLLIKYNPLTYLKIQAGNLLQNNNRKTEQKATNLTCKSLNGVQNGVLFCKIRWITFLFRNMYIVHTLSQEICYFYVHTYFLYVIHIHNKKRWTSKPWVFVCVVFMFEFAHLAIFTNVLTHFDTGRK